MKKHCMWSSVQSIAKIKINKRHFQLVKGVEGQQSQEMVNYMGNNRF
jgi:hypothetical protein